MLAQRNATNTASIMPPRLAKVRKVLDALKLTPDSAASLAGGIACADMSMDSWNARLLVQEINKLIDLKDKKVIELACGPVNEERTVILEAYRELGINCPSYVGIDPTIDKQWIGERGREANRIAYVPLSLYGLDDSAIDFIGKADVVLTSRFFGIPIGVYANMIMQGMYATLGESYIEGLFQHHFELWEIRGSVVADSLHGGVLGDFAEFMAQDICRRLVKEDGLIIHFVARGERSPDPVVAMEAGLMMEGTASVAHNEKHSSSMGDLFLLTPLT